MRVKGQLLISTFLLFFFNVFAQNAGAHANGGSDSDDGVMASTGVSISSNSAAALGVPAAMNEGLDAVQTKLSPSFASGDAETPLFIINSTNKQPVQAVYRASSSRIQYFPSHLGNPGLKYDADSEKRDKNNLGHYHRHYRRARRGGYTVPYFVGKRILEDMTDVEEDFPKRNPLDPNLLNRLHDQQEILGLSSEGSPPMIPDKRYAPIFVGKRSTKHQQQEHRVRREAYNAPYFVGKRTLEESENLEQEELQKRNIPNDSTADDLPDLPDLGILALNNEDTSELVDKRQAPLFVGKRRAPFFIGKRWAPYFVGRRQAPYFVGKRADLTASRRAAPLFVGRRRQAPLFIGRRHAPLFIGKRASAPLFIGKRGAPLFIGKRANQDWNELLSALHTLQAARHYRRMIQADKRHNAPFFIGRRSSPPDEGDVTDNAPEVKDSQPTAFGSMEEDKDSDSSWRENSPHDNSLDKRFNEFVGKRADDNNDNNAAEKRYEFIGKRSPYEFIGKRSYEFLGKRNFYEFLGKRIPYEFLGKRSPYEFLGKRNPYEFLGKRNPYEFLGKRSPYEFLGKRSPYEFLGKRNPYEFLGKRNPYEFLGKRTPYEFLGKRSPYEFLGKRNPYEFLGKRNPYEFLGKRTPYEFLGKRSPYEFIGKRSPAYEFLGKRNVYEFLGKRDSNSNQHLPTIANKRALIDFYGKRVELPYEFVGKRLAGGQSERVEDKGLMESSKTGSHDNANQSEADDTNNLKRYTEWLGKRGVHSPDQLHHTMTTTKISSLLSDLLRNGAGSSHSNGHEGKGLRKRYTEFVGK